MALLTAKSCSDVLANVIKVNLNAQAINNFDGVPQFYEVLSRVSKNGKPINPQEFILEKEADGSIVDYDITVLTQIMLYLRRGGQKYPLSVNISGETVNANSQRVLNILQGIEDKVIIEITETSKVDIAKATSFTRLYQSNGGKVALDDFNTFNLESSFMMDYKLNLLINVKPNIVKLVLPTKVKDIPVFYFIALKAFEKFYDFQFVIERIETKEMLLKYNQRFGCIFGHEPLFQGYYFDKGSLLIEDIL